MNSTITYHKGGSLDDSPIPMINHNEDNNVDEEEEEEETEEDDFTLTSNTSSSSSISLSTTTKQKVEFLVSFMVDARGGTMTGCRHSGMKVIIPPKTAPQPMRITCRYFKEDHLLFPPPLNEGEGLACRILKVGPRGCKFLGPVLIEVPHVSSVSDGEREIFVLRCNNGRKWIPHEIADLEIAREAVLKAATLVQSMSMSPSSSHSTTNNDNNHILDGDDEGDDISIANISRYGSSAYLEYPPRPLRNSDQFFHIVTYDFPQYFAVLSRCRQEFRRIGQDGDVIVSSLEPRIRVQFPPRSMTRVTRVGLSVKRIDHDSGLASVRDFRGKGGAVSPVVTVEPRRRKFHRPITVTIPVPESKLSSETSLRLVCSMSGNYNKAHWEDMTDTTPISVNEDGCISFTSVISAAFWLIRFPKSISNDDLLSTVDQLHKNTSHVPYWTRFHVYARKCCNKDGHVQVRVLILTEADRGIRPLELQEDYKEIARSDHVTVLDKSEVYVEFDGNLIEVEEADGEQQQNRQHQQERGKTFQPFSDNRQGFVVKRRNLKNPYGKGVIKFKSKLDQRTLFESKIDVSRFL